MSKELDDGCEKDLLGRKKDVDYLYNFIINRYKNNPEESLVLNINGKWGSGKTCLLKTLFNKYENNNINTMYYDAWKHDFTQEPFVSFVSCFADTFKESTSKKVKAASGKVAIASMKIIGKAASKKLFGLGEDELEELSGLPIETDELTKSMNNFIDKFGKEHSDTLLAITQIKSQLEIISSDDSKEASPLIVFIDELDRCRPNFAIELLEVIKHIFDAKGVYFILGTDTKQLQNSLHVVYGDLFDTKRYLKRFFDLEYTLQELSREKIIENEFEKISETIRNRLFNPYKVNENGRQGFTSLVEIISIFSEVFNLSIRDIRQIMNHLNIVLNSFNYAGQEKVHIVWLVFVLILKYVNDELYEDVKHVNEELTKKLKKSLGVKFPLLEEDLLDNVNRNEVSVIDIIGFYIRYQIYTFPENHVRQYALNKIVSVELENRNVHAHYRDETKLESLNSYLERIDNAGNFTEVD